MTTQAHLACPVQAAFDPLSLTFLADPFAVLATLPRETPVFYAPSIDYYVVTRYADIAAVLLDPETYSAAITQLPLVPLGPEGAWPCRRVPSSACGSLPRATTPRSSRSPKYSICAARTHRSPSPLGRVSTSVWAPHWPN